MAALYLHNAIFSPGASQGPVHTANTFSPQHRHQLSSQSIMTAPSYRTSLSEFSHPTDSLLHPGTSGSLAYADLLSRQPAHPSGPQPGWDLGLSLIGDPPTINERRDTWERAVKMRLKRLSLTKGMLELLMATWATYNTVRYVVAFESYSAFGAQAASLTLGASTTLSISLLTASWLLSAFSPHLISSRISHRLLHVTRRYLRYLSTLFLLAPAIAAFVLVFAWRNTADIDMHFRGRCHWDIDVVWSGPGSRCERHAPSWGVWLAASIVRLVFTLVVLVTYYLTSSAYSYTRRPSQIRNSRFRQRNAYKPSYSISEPSALPPTVQTVMTSSGTESSTPVSLTLTQQASSSTLVDHTRTRKNSSASAGPISIRSSQSRGSLFNLSSAGHISHVSSDPDVAPSGESHKYPGLGHLAASVDDYPTEASSQPTNGDLSGFADRFRSLVNQVSREVDDGLDIVRKESTTWNYAPSSYAEHHITQATTTADELERLLYSDEFAIEPAPAPAPEDHVIMLGGYVRRLSTIESIGSREMGSASSVHRNATFMSGHSSSGHTQQSRPPTRANTLTNDAAAESPSRDSLVATGGHGGGSASYHSASSGSKMFPENSDLLESPIEFDTSMQD